MRPAKGSTVGNLSFAQTPIGGVAVIHTQAASDSRGSFVRAFGVVEMQGLNATPFKVRQINLSRTAIRGSVRGMHAQRPPAAESKIVRVIRGSIFDVAVDIRKGSPTFMKWFGVELSQGNGLQLLLPEGVAHGFQTLCDDVEMLYMHTADFDPNLEVRLHYSDPRLAIAWPLGVTEVSDRDRSASFLDDTFQGIEQ